MPFPPHTKKRLNENTGLERIFNYTWLIPTLNIKNISYTGKPVQILFERQKLQDESLFVRGVNKGVTLVSPSVTQPKLMLGLSNRCGSKSTTNDTTRTTVLIPLNNFTSVIYCLLYLFH